jgi:GH15 family glucan-1,4-alpha-glucosidase
MAWVVFDRAVDAERFALEAPVERWKQVRDEIYAEACERGFDSERPTFTRYTSRPSRRPAARPLKSKRPRSC